jgi:hypothetical protein
VGRICKVCYRDYCHECAEWRAAELPLPEEVPAEREHEYPICSEECALKAVEGFLATLDPAAPVYLWNISNVGLEVGEDLGEDEEGRSLSLVHERLDPAQHEEDEEMTPKLAPLYGRVRSGLEATGRPFVEDFVPLEL